MPGAPVTIFNTNQLPISVGVNQGRSVRIGGASVPGLAPQASSAVGWNSGSPQPDALGPGTNHLTVMAEGSGQPASVVVNIPGNMPWMSVQLYLFADSQNVNWVLLNNGQYVAGKISG